ncbi:hypothetical protein ACIGEP_07135 [Microbacterium sp. NPDC077663]|uniref:hypothetical protein n=1 Tax=Microbacterium sp. NPDC077663 TaxID=3364189 RepID=UPI0037CC50FC
MTVVTFIVGGILTATGVVAYAVSGAASLTALIPAAIGVLIVIAAFIARSPKAHRHAIHAALAIALLGIIGTFSNVLKVGELFAGAAERPLAIVASIITFVVLIVYLVLGIRSFVNARLARARARKAA